MGSLGPTTVGSMSMAKAATAGNLPCTGTKNGMIAVGDENQVHKSCSISSGSYGFRMPLHYPRYKKADYESMPEWRVDCLLREYGLPVDGDLDSKRKFAMGAFLWPDQY
ncbi:hypothetical protein ACP70R_044348 [Stipagrostis hirtigluma subsp. patula]